MNTYYIVYEDWDGILQVYNTEESYHSPQRSLAAEQVTKWNHGDVAKFWIVHARSVDHAEQLAMGRMDHARQAAERRAEEREARRRRDETPDVGILENLFGRKERPAKMREAQNMEAGSSEHPRRGRGQRRAKLITAKCE